MGEGGAIVIRDAALNDRAEILREKGTNRSRYFRGQVDKYTWVDYGSSLLPSDMLAAYLWAQLQEADRINDDRRATWDAYYQAFLPLSERGLLGVPTVPEECVHNAHLFYVKLADLAERTAFMFYFIDANEGGWAATSLPIDSVYQRFVGDSPLNAVAQVDDDSFWRYDVDPARWSSTTDSYRIPRNGSLLFGLNGYTFYSSVYNSSIDRFQTELGLNDDGINFSYRNLEGRAVLEELLGTKYYLVPDDGGETTAYGYDNPVSTTTVDGHSYTVYQGDSTLPLGFAFSGVITRSQYESLSMVEKKNIDWGSLGFAYQHTDFSYVSNYRDGAWDDGALTPDHTIVMVTHEQVSVPLDGLVAAVTSQKGTGTF